MQLLRDTFPDTSTTDTAAAAARKCREGRDGVYGADAECRHECTFVATPTYFQWTGAAYVRVDTEDPLKCNRSAYT